MLDVRFDDAAIIDGTGAAITHGSIGVRDGLVQAVGHVDEPARRVVDCDGAAIAPGFVDVHVHYDAQILWDPTLSPSCLHGVTTVLGGNCGFTVAPVRPGDVDFVTRMLARVEGMPLSALETALEWDWSDFGNWLRRVERGLGVNAGFLVGHSTLRRRVMGNAASERRAHDDEVAAMVEELARSLDAGALGLSTSELTAHSDGDGRPVPSRFADERELFALAGALRGRPSTLLETSPAMLQGPTDAERDRVIALARASGRPVLWNALLVNHAEQTYQDRLLETGELAAREGLQVVGLTMPGPQTLRFAFTNVFVISLMDGWDDLFLLDEPARIAALADPGVRARMRVGLREGATFRHRRFEDVRIGECTVRPDRNGRSLGELAAANGRDALDELCDIAVEERLGCGFWPRPLGDDEASWADRATIWRRPDVLIGGSDAGAHLDVIADFSYPTTLLGPIVRDRAPFRLEEAVRLITDVPARLFGLAGRGRIAPGYSADLVVFDPDRIAPGPVELRSDLPAAARRLFAEAVGIASVWVNGEELVSAGRVTTVRAGQILRSRGR